MSGLKKLEKCTLIKLKNNPKVSNNRKNSNKKNKLVNQNNK